MLHLPKGLGVTVLRRLSEARRLTNRFRETYTCSQQIFYIFWNDGHADKQTPVFRDPLVGRELLERTVQRGVSTRARSRSEANSLDQAHTCR